MFGLGVIPEARRKGVATALARQAMQYLAGKGMERVESPVLTLMPGGTELLNGLGFVPVRWFSRMWRSLGEVPGDLGKRVGLALLDESETSITLLVRLNNEAFSEHYNYRPTTVEEMSYMLSRLRQDKVESKAIVARVGGELAGFLGFGIDPREIAQRGKKVGWLYQLGVLKPFRGQGVATSLIIAAMNWLKSKGMVEVELNVDDTNPTRAIRLYERLGFTVARKIVHFLRRLDR
jgi:mycothiol synthase